MDRDIIGFGVNLVTKNTMLASSFHIVVPTIVWYNPTL